MTTKTLKQATLLVVACISAAALCQAGESERGRKRGHDGQSKMDRKGGMGAMREMMFAKILENEEAAKEIGLSEEQIKTLRDGMYELRRREIELKAELEIAGMDQARLMTADSIDEKALMKAVENTGNINTEMAKLRIKQLLLAKQNLTKEQLQKIRKMVHRNMRSRRDKRDESGDDRRKRDGREERGRGQNDQREDWRERRQQMREERMSRIQESREIEEQTDQDE